MGTQHHGLMRQTDAGRQRASFRRLFVWYCAGILAATFVITCFIDLVGATWIVLKAHGRPPLFADPMAQVVGIALVSAVPLCALIAAVLFFAWLMGRKISSPVNELMRAVEKIRRQDLDFGIKYSANNELGDLCDAFNELRHELQASLEREWRRQEETRMQMAALAHDLRTPVTIIQGHVEGLARTEAGEKRSQRLERYLPVLEASSERMTRLLNDILLVASLEETGFVIRPRPVLLEKELERKAHVYQLQAATHVIEFSFIGPSLAAPPPPVCLDLHRVEQVLDNLFENALRYTPAHGQISLIYMRDARTLSFVLRDTGRGIAQQDLPHVFEKFYRGQALPDEKAHKAAGLGLYTAKLLAEGLGGTIAIRNHPDGGCEVTVSLPLAVSE